jgi:hypothetical protein
MAVAQGYGKTVTSGSVFAYDVADFRNSYIGKPGYNVTGPPAAWVGNNNTSDFKTTIGTTTVNIPAIGTREVSFVDIWNTGASNCCPSLFRYGTWGTSTGVAGSTLYTYSIIYKTKSGYTHPNFMYRYEYNGGSYITEVGVFDTAKRIDLGDGWYQAYNTFTTNASTNVLYLGMWYYQYNVYDTVYLYKASLTQGTHTFPPEQIIPPITTRSATQGLLPLVGNSTIDLTNVSFDSSAQMTFDGTNDYVSAGDTSVTDFGTGDFTVECVVKIDSSIPVNNGYFKGIVVKKGAGGPNAGFGIYFNTGYGKFLWSTANGSLGSEIFTTNTWNSLKGSYAHVVMVRQNGATNNGHFYINGIYESIASSPTVLNVNNDYNLTIGASSTLFSDYFFLGEIPVVKIYNRALSAGELRQNYLHYKTRFNLS